MFDSKYVGTQVQQVRKIMRFNVRTRVTRL
jgi:hypothetical protein